MKERIQKVLANAGVESRRKVEEMVRQGRVAVNGKVRTDLPILIDPSHDRVTVDDEAVKLAGGPGGGGGAGEAGPGKRLYFLMNKPKGVYTTNVAQGVQTRAIDLLPPELPGRVYPVGRLDADTKGLLLLTNDGELTNRLTHPRYGVPKTYRAVVDGFVTPQTVQELEQGVWLPDREGGKPVKTGPSRITVVKRSRDRSIVDIMVREGRNPQVRRMLAKMGHKVRDLIRVRMGPLTLEGLAPGEFRPLSGREIKALREVAERKARARKDGKGPAAAKATKKPGRAPGTKGPPVARRAEPEGGAWAAGDAEDLLED